MMGWCVRFCRLLPALMKRYWVVVAWGVTCSVVFYIDYKRYKRQPQYYYIRRMLGVSMCVSRGSAAVLNLSCCMLVLPMCRALLTTFSNAISACFTPTCRSHPRPPSLPTVLAAPATHTAKTTHLMVAVTLVITSIIHTSAHINNAINFSRHFSQQYPDINVANFRGENPLWLFVKTVPGLTGVAMMVILVVLCATSTRWVRRRNYDVFFYTHYLGIIFLILAFVHPLSGVLKEQKNLEGHIPGCIMYDDLYAEEEGFPEPDPEGGGGGGYPEPEPFIDGHSRYRRSHNSNNNNKSGPPWNSLFPLGSPGISDPAFDNDRYSHSDLGSDNEDLRFVESDTFRDPSGKDDEGEETSGLETPRNGRRKKAKCHSAPIFGSVTSRTWAWVGVALVIWAIDHAIRWRRRRDLAQIVAAIHHPWGVLQLTLRQSGLSCIPGQYVLLQCPEVSRFEWHPFTVVTTPLLKHSPDTFTIYMRTRGDWSSRVAKLLESNSEGQTSIGSHNGPRSADSSLHHYSQRQRPNHNFPSPHQSSSKTIPHKVINNKSNFLPCCHHPHLCTSRVDEFRDYSFSPGDNTKETNCLNSRLISNSFSQQKSNSFQNECLSKHRVLSLSRSSSSLLSIKRKHRYTSIRKSHSYHGKPVLFQQRHCVSQQQNCQHPATYRSSSPSLQFTSQMLIGKHVRNMRPDFNLDWNSLQDYDAHPSFEESVERGYRCYKWTEQQRNDETAQKENHHIVHMTTVPNLRFHVDGPFSSPSENMLRHPVVIGAAGGIGITPVAATLSHILQSGSQWPSRIHVVWVVRDARLFLTLAPLLSGLLHHIWRNHTEDRLELRLHVTLPTPTELLQDLFAQDHPGLLPRISQGRPQWKHLFREWGQIYTQDKVGVFACGPRKMCRQVKRHCLGAISRKAPFTYYQESFS